MLALSLEPNEYITINNDIVVTVAKLSKGRCSLFIDADRSVPVVRGEVLERNGNPPPPSMENYHPPRRPKRKNGVAVRWDKEQEQAMLILEKVADRLERKGDVDEAKILRAQLRQIGPVTQTE